MSVQVAGIITNSLIARNCATARTLITAKNVCAFSEWSYDLSY
jgi:hypothetical protein